MVVVLYLVAVIMSLGLTSCLPHRLFLVHTTKKLAVACDFQQCGILISVDSDKPVQPPFKLRNSEWCSVSSLTIIEYSSD